MINTNEDFDFDWVEFEGSAPSAVAESPAGADLPVAPGSESLTS